MFEQKTQQTRQHLFGFQTTFFFFSQTNFLGNGRITFLVGNNEQLLDPECHVIFLKCDKL